jgi:hypothetical protein
MSTLEKVNERVTLLENANKASTISPAVWDAFRKFISNKPGLITSIEQHLNYYYFTSDRLMHFIYAMAGVFTGDVSTNAVNQQASTAKNMQSNAVIADVISRLISVDKGHRDQACEFVLKSKCGLAKATATSNMLQTGVVEELMNRASHASVGVLVIHMYVDPPSLNNVFTGEGSAINKMVAVIEAAKKVNAPIFLVWKHDNETLGPTKLRDAVRGYKSVEQYVCLHNSFLNNRDHADSIRQKNLNDMFIMGYDADVCVKGTMFGSEYANPIPNKEIEEEYSGPQFSDSSLRWCRVT